MTNNLTQEYRVKFVVTEEDRDNWTAEFIAHDPESVKNIVAACSGFNSGDDCRCWINGEEAVLEGDWGLLL